MSKGYFPAIKGLLPGIKVLKLRYTYTLFTMKPFNVAVVQSVDALRYKPEVRVGFLIGSLGFFIDLVLRATLGTWALLSI